MLINADKKDVSIDAELFLAIATVVSGIALLGGVWLTLRRPTRRQRADVTTRRGPTTTNPVALALHHDTLQNLIGLTEPRAGMVQQAAEAYIQDRTHRLEWAQFDHEFISACMKRVAGSWICAPESFRRFSIKDERLLLLSEQIYLESLGRAKQTKDPDGRILRGLSEAYADARSYMRYSSTDSEKLVFQQILR
jgi:hypothetical protein